MTGVYTSSSTVTLSADEEIPPPVIDKVVTRCETLYSAASSEMIPGYGASFAPGKKGKSNFMYGALGNDGIFDDEIASVISEKMGLWKTRNRTKISRRDFLLAHGRIEELVSGYDGQISLEDSDLII